MNGSTLDEEGGDKSFFLKKNFVAATSFINGSTHSWRIHFAFSSFMLEAMANAQMNVSQAGVAFGITRGGIRHDKDSGAARDLSGARGLAAAAVLVLSAAPQQRAEALSLASPGTLRSRNTRPRE